MYQFKTFAFYCFLFGCFVGFFFYQQSNFWKYPTKDIFCLVRLLCFHLKTTSEQVFSGVLSHVQDCFLQRAVGGSVLHLCPTDFQGTTLPFHGHLRQPDVTFTQFPLWHNSNPEKNTLRVFFWFFFFHPIICSSIPRF